MSEAVRFDGVGFQMSKRIRKGGKGRAQRLRRFTGEQRRKPIWQLRDLSFHVEQGEAFAIVGTPDSGRDTVLRLAARTLLPDEGKVTTAGLVVPMFDLVKAMSRGFTVRQNIHLLGGLLGMGTAEVNEKLPGIVEFAGANGVVDGYLAAAPALLRPRLAFAIATSVDGSTYAVDDMLTVGDAEFRRACMARMVALRESGRSVLLVTDNGKHLRGFCSRGLLLWDGHVAAEGSVPDVIDVYKERLQRRGAGRRRRRDEPPPHDDPDPGAVPLPP